MTKNTTSNDTQLIAGSDLWNWRARRSGATMTVTGVSANGNPVRLAGVIDLTPAYDVVIAKCVSGRAHSLHLGRRA